MMNNKSSYRQILKATSIFGGVQVFQILISIIRSKIIAIFLGPSGMGIANLFMSTLGLVTSLTNFGLGTSAIRNVAEAYASGDEIKISKVVAVFRKLVWITGLLGTIITLISSKWLSQMAFGNQKYYMAFMWLSVTLLFDQLTKGQNVILQGTRKLNDLAKANLYGSIFGLFISVPIYYYYRIDGIVPALIITSILGFIIAFIFAKKVIIPSLKVSKNETKTIGKNMLYLGIVLGLNGMLVSGSSYILQMYISRYGGIVDVGLYAAGFTIITTYVGLVFMAMSTDYFPRLSEVANDRDKSTLIINQQAEIGVLILSPILTVFLVYINWIITVLYTSKFIPVTEMIQWAALGMYFKVVSWCLGYLLLAKGIAKIYFWAEFISVCYSFILNIICYNFFGLEGLGISYMLGYLMYLIQIFLMIKIRYKFDFNYQFYKIFGVQLLIGVLCFLIIKFTPKPWAYVMGTPFILLSTYYSYKELDKRLELENLIKGYLKN